MIEKFGRSMSWTTEQDRPGNVRYIVGESNAETLIINGPIGPIGPML